MCTLKVAKTQGTDKAELVAPLVSCEIHTMRDPDCCLRLGPCQTILTCLGMDPQALELLLDVMAVLELGLQRSTLTMLDCRFLRGFDAEQMKFFLDVEVWRPLHALLALQEEEGERQQKRHNGGDVVQVRTIQDLHQVATSFYLAYRLVSILQTAGATPAWKSKAQLWLAQGGGGDWKWLVLILAELMSILEHIDGGKQIIKSEGNVRWVKVRLGNCFIPGYQSLS